MRNRFDNQLHELNNEIINMGALVESSIAAAVKALEKRDERLARQIASSDHVIDDKEREIEQLCLKLLLQQQPVASDLRLISAAMKMITDIERIGDQSADISELTLLLCRRENFFMPGQLRDMAQATITMVSEAIDAFVKKDLQLAHQVIAYDDTVDDLFDEVKAQLIRRIHDDHDAGETAVDLLMIAKYLERIGDHAVNVAEWVCFSITGRLKDEE